MNNEDQDRSSRTLLLIHGMWGGPWCWEDFGPFFEGLGYRVIAPALRHHQQGAEPAPEALGWVSLLDYAADLESVVHELDAPPVLIGHSMGGLLVQMLAARGLACAAVCLTPAPPMGILAVRRPSVVVTFAHALHRIVARQPVRPRYGSARHTMLNRMPEAERQRQFDLLGSESGRAISEIGLRTYRRIVPYFDPDRASEVDERRVTCPMLVVGAKHDRTTPLPIAQKVAQKYGADYEELSDYGHSVLARPAWRDVAELVARWLEARGL